jgi:methylthioribose-1-phosphate isomerase
MMRGDHSCAAVLCPLSCSRPTAVNLSDSAVKLKAVAAAAAGQPGATAESVTAAVVAAAEATMQEDIDANKVGVPSDSYGLLKGHPSVCVCGGGGAKVQQ